MNIAQAEVAAKEAALAEYEAKTVQHAEALRGRDTQLAAKAEAVSSLEAKVSSLSEGLEKVLGHPHLPLKACRQTVLRCKNIMQLTRLCVTSGSDANMQ